MKFSELRKELAEDVGVPAPVTGAQELDLDLGSQDDEDLVRIETDLSNALHLLKKSSIYLEFFLENCKHHGFLTKKSKATLNDLVDEIGLFLEGG